MLVKFQVNKFYISFFSFFILCPINAQIALPTFHGVHKYHPPPNYGFNFDGNDDVIDCGDIDKLDHADYFTVMFWFKRTVARDGINEDTNHLINNVMFSQGTNGSNDNIEIGTEGTNIEIYLDTPGTDYMFYDAGISDSTWYHIAITYNKDSTDAECLLYVDGELGASFSEPRYDLDDSRTSPITIGDTKHYPQPFTGLIDEVAVWTRVLPSSQISEIYNSGSGIGDVTTSHSSDLELYIKFEQNLNDDSGNSHNGTFSGPNGTNSSATYNNITSSIPLN